MGNLADFIPSISSCRPDAGASIPSGRPLFSCAHGTRAFARAFSFSAGTCVLAYHKYSNDVMKRQYRTCGFRAREDPIDRKDHWDYMDGVQYPLCHRSVDA